MTSTMTPPAAATRERARSFGDPRRAPRATASVPAPTKPIAAAEPAVLTVPTRDEIIAETMRQTNCTLEQAECFYTQAILGPVQLRLQHAGATNLVHHIQQDALDLMHDQVLDTLIADDATAPELGTVHYMANRHASDLVGEDVEIVHSKFGTGPATYCGTTTSVRNRR